MILAFTKLLHFLVKIGKVSFASSRMKQNLVFPPLSKFAVKSIY